MSTVNDISDAVERIWEILGDLRDEATVPEYYRINDSTWEDVCESMETIRVECGLPSPLSLTWDGWEIIGTGGGCEAYCKQLPRRYYLLATCADGSYLHDDGDDLLVGLYHDDGPSEGLVWTIKWTDKDTMITERQFIETQCRVFIRGAES